MAQNSAKKLPQNILQADLEVFAGLKTIEGYKPANPLYEIAAIQTVKDEMEALQLRRFQLETEIDTVRDLTNKKENEMHERAIGATTSVEAQFGRDSNELQAVGKKKVSDYKKHKAKKPVPK
jgi:predicted  nucleic acid-binding Zn-ribbon protein